MDARCIRIKKFGIYTYPFQLQIINCYLFYQLPMLGIFAYLMQLDCNNMFYMLVTIKTYLDFMIKKNYLNNCYHQSKTKTGYINVVGSG